jgi:hypothetical protein
MGNRSVAIALLGTAVAKDPMVEPDAQRRRRGDHDAVESVITTVEPVITMPWNERSRWRGTGDHDGVAHALA